MINLALKMILVAIFWRLLLVCIGFAAGYYYANNKEKVNEFVLGKAKEQKNKAQEELKRRLDQRVSLDEWRSL